MPDVGDGLTVVSAMRHVNPKAVTIIASAFPQMNAAAQAILLQADQILIKPMDITTLVTAIRQRRANETSPARAVESVATILERSIPTTIAEWYERVEGIGSLTVLAMSRAQRTEHVPRILMDLVDRLRSFAPLGSTALKSIAAQQHGILRHKQGYSTAMMVEESRMLLVSIFHTLEMNLANIDFGVVLSDVMTIADEVNWQLSQAMASYAGEAAS
jgi:YesN/AraC family two-component response regulator